MNKLLATLLANAPEIDNPVVKSLRADAPVDENRRYLDCQVVLKSGYQMAGVLTTHGAMFVLGAIAQTPDKRVLVAYHYFTADDVETVVVGKDLPDQLVKPVRNGGPIILGH